MNEQELKTTIDKTPIAGMFAAELEKKGLVSVDGELFALGPVMPGDVKPTQSGWYARNYGNWRAARDWWNGSQWFQDIGGWLHISKRQNLQWRGISVEPNAQAIADAMFEDARQLANVRNQAPPVRNPTPTTAPDTREDQNCKVVTIISDVAKDRFEIPVAPDTREANDLPRDYLDPEGILFDFDGMGERGKVVTYGLGALLIVVLVGLLIYWGLTK